METKEWFFKKKIFIALVISQIFLIIFVFKIGIEELTTLWQEADNRTGHHGKVNSPFTIIPEIPKDTSLLIVINTIPSKFQRRETLRGTWAKRTSLSISANSPPSKPHDNMTVAYFFTVGFEENSTVNMDTEREAAIHKDILRVHLKETYRGILSKLLLTFEWVASLDVKSRFIVKADDDVYIKLPDLARWLLSNAPPPVKLYAGFVHSGVKVIRSPDSPWYVSLEQYKNNYFPDYCAGPFYILSRNVFFEVVNASKFTRVFPVEDVYIGVLVNKIGVKPTDEGWQLFNWNRDTNSIVLAEKEGILSGIVLGDSLTSAAIQKLHRFYGKITVS